LRNQQAVNQGIAVASAVYTADRNAVIMLEEHELHLIFICACGTKRDKFCRDAPSSANTPTLLIRHSRKETAPAERLSTPRDSRLFSNYRHKLIEFEYAVLAGKMAQSPEDCG
jgi:hypothetical protein